MQTKFYSKLKPKSIFFLLGTVLIMGVSMFVMPYGIDKAIPIESYLNGVFPTKVPGTLDGSGNWKVVDAYPNLTFIDPIAMEELPDKSGFFVGGKKGYIWKIGKDPNTSSKKTVLDISAKTTIGGDGGFINFILHPEFGDQNSPNRGYAYLMYRHNRSSRWNCNDGVDRLSRFVYNFDRELFDPDSELILLQQYSPKCNHMGGALFFDEEGLLYVSTGDGGGAGAQYNYVQSIDEALFGGLLRIDVDMDRTRSHPIRRQPAQTYSSNNSEFRNYSQFYFIPNDNPWLDANGGVLEEFYALGFRSPHRAALDNTTGNIWIGDVGEGKREEIAVVKKGENHQWPYKEGEVKGPKSKPSNLIGKETTPFYTYGRSEGNCIIGGFVYRGNKWKNDLEGLYLFGDHGTRNVWTINPANQEVKFLVNIPESGRGSKNGLSTFSTDSEGNVYMLKVFSINADGGQIFKLVRDGEEVPNPPSLLSETGVFEDLESLTPIPGIIPYDVNTPLWSDGALKKRWIALANDGTFNDPSEQISFFENGEWQFPKGTVFIKHFELPDDPSDSTSVVRLETRFLVLTESGGAYGVTYRWNEDGTDAYLIDSEETRTIPIKLNDGTEREQTWTFPGRTQCMTCHTANSNFVLGVKTWQLNKDLTYPSTQITSNQLATWNHLNIFNEPIDETKIEDMPRLASIHDTTASLAHRVYSYLDANCSNCHRPNGVEAVFDARYSTAPENKKIINQLGVSRHTPEGGLVVKPGDHTLSQLWIRDHEIGDLAMPPIGKSINDTVYLEVLKDWINGLVEEDSGDCETSYVYLSDLDWIGTPINGRGPIRKDLSNDRNPLIINEVVYEKGLGVHAESSVTYQLGGQYSDLTAYLGVDDETCRAGSVVFVIEGDGALLYRSELIRNGDEVVFIDIPIAGVNELILSVEEGNNGGACDHANWADIKLKKCIPITNNPPVAVIIAANTSGTVPFTASFDGSNSTDPDGDELTHTWLLENEEAHEGVTLDYTYESPGTYQVQLIVDDGSLRDTATIEVIADGPANQAPIAVINATPNPGIVPFTVSFDGSNSTDPDEDNLTYTWLLENGETHQGATFDRIYENPGRYQVQLIVDDGSLKDTATIEVIAEEPPNQAPVAIIMANPTSGVIPFLVNFDGSSSTDTDGDNLTYTWVFENGVTKNGVRASQNYNNPGNYVVQLIVSDGSLKDTSNIEIVAEAPANKAPIAGFSATPTSGMAPLLVSFDASNSSDPDGDNLEYSWNFGDGSSGTGLTIAHEFINPGSYEVELVVSDGSLTNSITQFIQVDAANNPPKADFTVSIQEGVAPLKVVFNAQSSSDPEDDVLAFNWDFGNGQTGSGDGISNVYNNPGIYTATLWVSDGEFTDEVSKEIVVRDPFEQCVDTNSVSLTEIPWSGTPINGDGAIKVNESNDGNPLTINGKVYEKGLGVHANAAIRYLLGGVYSRFETEIGVDDEACSFGSVVFEIYGDGALLYRSGLITQKISAQFVSVDVKGIKELVLKVNDGNSFSRYCDHGDWANPTLFYCDNAISFDNYLCGVSSGNVSLEKNTTQSSFTVDGQSWRSVDGDTVNSFMHTQLEENPWWEIDLEYVHQIEQLKVYSRIDCCLNDPETSYIFISEEPFESDDCESIKNQPGVKTINHGIWANKMEEIPVFAKGRYIRIQSKSVSYMSLSEVEVIGCISSEENVVNDIWLEAECGDLADNLFVFNGNDASNDLFVAGESLNNNDTEVSSYSFDVTTSGTYELYLRARGFISINNAISVRLNNQSWYQVDLTFGSEHFNWIGVPIVPGQSSLAEFDLDEGVQKLEIRINGEGVMIDKVLVTGSRALPVGFGEFGPPCNKAIEDNIGLGKISEGKFGFREMPEGAIDINTAPNPFNQSFEIYLQKPPSSNLDRAIVRVYDSNGRIIYENFDANFEQNILVDPNIELTPGIYFVKVQSGQFESIEKIIKKSNH